MKQFPKRLKYTKNYKPKKSYLNLIVKQSYPILGFYALKVVEAGFITFKEIEAGRRAIKRYKPKSENLWKLNIKPFMYFSKTKKPSGSRMGKGKGPHSKWVCPLRKGFIIYELTSFNEVYMHLALRRAANKISLKTKIIKLMY